MGGGGHVTGSGGKTTDWDLGGRRRDSGLWFQITKSTLRLWTVIIEGNASPLSDTF